MDKENTVIPNKRMLVIDDMEMNRDIMSKIFQFDFEIIEAENGLIAMDILHKQETAIDIVILDLVMPEKDGYAVLKEMREDPVLKTYRS